MAVVHQKEHDALFATLKSGEHRTIWVSCCSKESAAWLLSIPWTHKGTQGSARANLRDENFRVSAQARLRHRISIRPAGMVPEAFKCELCGKQLDEYGDHPWSCQFMGGFRTIDHSGLQSAMLAVTSQIQNVQSLHEPNIAELGCPIKLGVFAPSRGDPAGYRADLVVNTDRNGLRNTASMLIVDYTITSPLTKIKENEGGLLVRTNAGMVTSGGGRKQGAAADEAVKRKEKKYLERFEMSKEQFYPFAMETTGFMHGRALDFVKQVAGLQSEYMRRHAPVGLAHQQSSIGACYRRIIERIAVAQQIGYSRLLLNYQQKCVPR